MKKLTKKITLILLSAIIFLQAEELYSGFQSTTAYHPLMPYSADPNHQDVYMEY